MKKILFICTGNICRSPSAEAILRKMLSDAGKNHHVDSAGTGSWHAGDPPDSRAVAACEKRDYSTEGILARPIRANDFAEFDVIYAMTKEHEQFLLHHAPECASKIKLFLSTVQGEKAGDVPDPYYGGDNGFGLMMDMLEKGCTVICAELD